MVIDPFVLVGFKNIPDLHKMLVSLAKSFGRGVLLMMVDFDEETNHRKLRQVQARRLEDFQLQSTSNEEIIMFNAISHFIEQYDTAHQYSVMIMVNDLIIGGGVVPFENANELECVIDDALVQYLNR